MESNNVYVIPDITKLLNQFRKILQEENEKKEDSKENSDAFPYIKIEEAARLLKVSKPTIYDWINRKIFKIYKIGSRSYLNKREIMEYLEKQNLKRG